MIGAAGLLVNAAEGIVTRRRSYASLAASGTPRGVLARAALAETLMLTPAALYVQLAIAECNPQRPPPWGLRSTRVAARWAWLVEGTAQWFSGQTSLARPAIARRLRDDARPEFPPGLKDAGGSLVDLVTREQGARAVVKLACSPLPPGGPRQALLEAFDGRALVHTEGTWRAHLSRLAGQ